GALKAAEAADQEVKRHEQAPERLGPLHGVPLSVKDLEVTKGLQTTFGSKVFKDFIPHLDSVVVERVRKSGAVILGKTTPPEFGNSIETYNLLGPACHNPWDMTRTSGGSSGGSAVSVVAGMCAVAVGGDCGGGLRLPCHFSGLYGIKPTQ